jgi:hypothetical protein
MEENLENIILVPYMDISQWPNDLHLQFNQTQDEQMDAEYDAENPAPAKLATAIADHKAAVQAENAAYIIVRGSELTEQIAAQDNIRDTKMDEVTSVVNAMLRVASLPTMQQAAQVFKRGWDVYSPNAKAAYEAETTDLQQWHEDYLASADQQQAARTLGIEQIIADMMAANAEVHRLIVLRENTQGQQRTATTLKDARVQTDKAYKWMMLVLNSYHVVDANPARFDTVTSNLISQQDYYLGLVRERQRNNKRVFVGSELVGNHYYNVSTGWTWLTLAQKNSKALAPDPVPSAPGVEPVVVPQRIVSADKKAVQAGGLCVALDGVPVRPSDAVDVTKKYELIPIPTE